MVDVLYVWIGISISLTIWAWFIAFKTGKRSISSLYRRLYFKGIWIPLFSRSCCNETNRGLYAVYFLSAISFELFLDALLYVSTVFVILIAVNGLIIPQKRDLAQKTISCFWLVLLDRILPGKCVSYPENQSLTRSSNYGKLLKRLVNSKF